jgi:hypothetical protein
MDNHRNEERKKGDKETINRKEKNADRKKGQNREQRHIRLYTEFLLPSFHVRCTNSRP